MVTLARPAVTLTSVRPAVARSTILQMGAGPRLAMAAGVIALLWSSLFVGLA